MITKKIISYVKDFVTRSDMVLLALCCICSIFGLVMISSATASFNTSRFILVQLVSIVVGLGLYIFFTVIDIEIIADKWVILLIAGVLFIASLVFLGEEGDTGNKGWIRFFGIGIQPSEVVKVVFVVILAQRLSYLKEYGNLNSFLSIISLAAIFLLLFGLIIVVSSDLGSALVYLFIFIVMLFAAGVKLYWFALGIGSVAVLTPFLWQHFLRQDQRERILAPYDPTIDPNGWGINWQPRQGKLALASGRLTGTGLFNGTQTQSDALSAKQTDFIFAAIGEELGMIGCCVVIILLLLIIIRCVYIGIKSKNTLNMLVCIGMASFMFFQTFENIGMVIGVTPVIGLTLPFFSYGGSSIISTFAAMGIVSGIKYRPKAEHFRMYD